MSYWADHIGNTVPYLENANRAWPPKNLLEFFKTSSFTFFRGGKPPFYLTGPVQEASRKISYFIKMIKARPDVSNDARYTYYSKSNVFLTTQPEFTQRTL